MPFFSITLMVLHMKNQNYCITQHKTNWSPCWCRHIGFFMKRISGMWQQWIIGLVSHFSMVQRMNSIQDCVLNSPTVRRQSIQRGHSHTSCCNQCNQLYGSDQWSRLWRCGCWMTKRSRLAKRCRSAIFNNRSKQCRIRQSIMFGDLWPYGMVVYKWQQWMSSGKSQWCWIRLFAITTGGIFTNLLGSKWWWFRWSTKQCAYEDSSIRYG